MRDMEDLLEMRGGKKGFFLKLYLNTPTLCVFWLELGLLKILLTRKMEILWGELVFSFF